MTPIRSEAELVAVAHALAGTAARYCEAERQVISTSTVRAQPRLVSTVRGLIQAGLDPLGDAFLEIRSGKERRIAGAIYTPPELVRSMFDWAAPQQSPARVVDPGCGSGRFILEAAARYPRARLVAVDTDPLAILLLRANAAVLRLNSRLESICGDFRELVLPPVSGATLFIGNPPYVRHHGISGKWKEWFSRTSVSWGLKASKLSGLHVHFFIKTRHLARPGDCGCYITAAEWLDVNYGRVVRDLLADGLGGTDLYLFDPGSLPFADTLTTAAVTRFEIGARRPTALAMHEVDCKDGIPATRRTVNVAWNELSKTAKWSVLSKPRRHGRPESIELGELFRVHRGQVTGSNRVWILGEGSPRVPERFLWPTVTRAKELFAADCALTDASSLRRVIDFPVELDSLEAHERREVERFLEWARANGANAGFVSRHRKAWWSVGLRAPAPIICTYMARRPPTFIRNLCDARHLNIAHGLYPRVPLSSGVLDAIATELRLSSSTDGGRTYAGGLVKFEPREIERLRISVVAIP